MTVSSSPPREPLRRGAIVALVAGILVVVLVVGGAGLAAVLTNGFGGLIVPAAAPGGESGSGDGRGDGANGSGSETSSGAGDGTGTGTTGETGSGTEVGTTPTQEPTPVAPPEPTYTPTVLILDASGSMVRDVAGGGTRMEAARSAAITFVEGLGDDAQLGLTVFGTGTGNSDAEQAAGCFDVKVVVPVGPIDKGALTSAISGIQESGYTPLGPSLRNAVGQLPTDEPTTIVLVSDGVDTCSPPPSCDVAAELREQNPLLTIHAVGFGVDADEAAQEQLQCIARVGGGEYLPAANAVQLAAKLRVASDPLAAEGAVTSRGLGALRLGMSLSAAQAAEPTLEKVSDPTVEVIYVDCDYATLEFRKGVLTAIIPRTEAPTVEGLAPGDTMADAVELYGDPTDQGSDDDGAYSIFPAASDGINGYRVYADSNRIIRIVVCVCGPNQADAGRDFSTWEFNYEHFGPLQIGMTFDEAYASYGGEPVPYSDDGYLTFENCPVGRLDRSGVGDSMHIMGGYVEDSSGKQAISLDIQAISVGGWGNNPSSAPRTDRGVGLGSTAADLERAYPGITEVNDQKYGRYMVVTGRNGISLVFRFYDDTDSVSYVQMGTWTGPPYEICA